MNGEDVVHDHPALYRLLQTRVHAHVLPETAFYWNLDKEKQVTHHKLSSRWLVRLTSPEVPGFSWYISIKSLLKFNDIKFTDSVSWNATLQSKLNNLMSRRCSHLCACLAVRTLPGYPASFL